MCDNDALSSRLVDKEIYNGTSRQKHPRDARQSFTSMARRFATVHDREHVYQENQLLTLKAIIKYLRPDTTM